MIVNKNILLSLLVIASLAGCCTAQNNYGVVEAANDLGNLNTFVKAVDQAGLTDKLNNKGILTFRNHTYIAFAPNDAAFNSLPSATLNSLMQNKDDLNTLLNYHIVEDANVNDIGNLRDVNTLKALDGKNLNISYSNGLMVNGARVLSSRKYDQGIIYVIDRVLLPDDNAFLDKYNLRGLRTGNVAVTTNETTRTAPSGNYGIVEAANDLGNLNTFMNATNKAGLVDRLNNKNALNVRNHTYIVFAPNDAAFNSLPSATLNSLMQNKDDLNTLLNYHIVEDANVNDIGNLRDVNTLKALDGRNLNLSYSNGLMVNGARVSSSRKYDQGIIYVIDRVLLPDDNAFLDKYNLRGLRTEYVTTRTNETTVVGRTNATTNISERRPMSVAERNLLDSLRSEDDLRTFTEALTAADLGAEVYNITNLTLFAPNDQAFSVIPRDRWNNLLANRDDLRRLMRYHIVDRTNITNWTTTEGPVMGPVRNLEGRELVINRTDGEITVGNATIVRTKYYNDSIIYVIDRVLLPNDANFLDKYGLRDIEARNTTVTRVATDED